MMENVRIVGHVVGVHGLRVTVELLSAARSPLRATPEGVHVAVAINSYLTFSLGAGQVMVGVITDLDAREAYDPQRASELSLELVKPRRTAQVQLLGTIVDGTFDPGITILPTLDASAEICDSSELAAIFGRPPMRNRPELADSESYDIDLSIGWPTGQPSSRVKGSYNDLLSRPLAIVGNTGSGKSFTVSSILQGAMAKLPAEMSQPHVIVLDINGEYGNAFPGRTAAAERVPDRLYLNGEEFGVPLWLLNADEVCAWLSAAEQTQAPVLKDWWALAKGSKADASKASKLQNALLSMGQLESELSSIKRKSAPSYCDAICGHLAGTGIDSAVLQSHFVTHRTVNHYNVEVLANQADIAEALESLRAQILAEVAQLVPLEVDAVRTADTPRYIALDRLLDPTLVSRALPREDAARLESHLTTLKLRLRARLEDRRWRPFLNYEAPATKVSSLEDWLGRFGLGALDKPRVSILDCSMLSNEVLPFACALVGRVLLECRQCLPAASRFRHPWVLVLEEAHNYARPARFDEDRGHSLSRLTFERIAKEGRKFGLSLIVASQRPSEISATIISQCANFICHRLQNPDDIEHFRQIIPVQARRLLDQVTILSSGEAIVFGSAFHVPSRVSIQAPEPSPHSQTAAPYHEWSTSTSAFPVAQVLASWGLIERGAVVGIPEVTTVYVGGVTGDEAEPCTPTLKES